MNIFTCSILLLTFAGLGLAFELEVRPLVALQGETLVVRLLDPIGGRAYRCFLDGTEYPFYNGEGSELCALIGLPSDFKPGRYPIVVREEGGDGSISSKELWLEVREGDFPVQSITFTREKRELIEDPGNEIERRLIREGLKTESKRQLWRGTFLMPVKGRISGSYGARRVDERGEPYWIHKGIDIVKKEGARVLAANSGRVVLAREDFNLHGKTILIDHGQGVMSIYLHLASIEVKEGEEVLRGQVLGRVGQTGLATSPHLHFGIYLHGIAVNPWPWFEVGF